MHNLSGVYVKEDSPKEINGTKYFSFSVIYPKKTRTYYCEKESECKEWVEKIRKVTGYKHLTDLYSVGVGLIYFI